MNNNQRFDENIKEQFSNYAPDVHPRIWENIIAEKEKRKPAGFWFNLLNSRNILVLLGLLIAGGSGAYLFIKNSSDPATAKNNTSALIEKDKQGNNTQVPSPENNNNITNNKTTAPITATVLTTENNNAAHEPVNNSKSMNSPAVTRINVGAPSIESANDGPPANINKKRITGSGPLTSKDNSSTGLASGITDNSPGEGSLLGRLLYETQKISTETKSKPELQKRKSPFWLLPDCPAMEKDAAGNKKYIEIYAGPDFAIRKLSDTGNSVYLQKRKESAKFSSAYSAGIRYTRVFSNSMSIRTGINYSQINEKFTFVQGNLVQITYIINANGDTTGSYITTGTRYKTTHNKYRSVDVPLLVGYEMGNGKLHANISAGAVVNIYSWQKGEVLDTTLQPVSITTGKGSSPYGFKTNAGLGFMGSATVYYKLNEKVHVMAEPYFRYNFTPINKDNLTLKQKYSTVGLRLGIRVDLK